MPAQSPPHGAPIARGNTSDLWAWSDTTVVKVLRPGIPASWATIEADILMRVHAAGLPVPQTEGVVEFDGRPGIVLERVDGTAMWERMKSAPETIPALVRQLIDLQREVQETSVNGLPAIEDRLLAKIGEASQLAAEERQEAERLLAQLPRSDRLCHGDFHPANIIMSERGPIILDWYDAGHGDVAADFVRSSLLMRPPTDRTSWLAGATPDLVDRIHSDYVTELLRRDAIDPRMFGPWEAVVAVARMSEPVPDEDLIAIWEHWRARGSSVASALLDRREGS